jgi:tRNA(adenine34) deaminase
LFYHVIYMDQEFMNVAIEEAKIALSEGEVPVGAVIVKDGKIIAQAHNTRETDLDISGHAEINAMRLAAKALGKWTLDGCAIYVTLEPCVMCAGALLQSRISTIVYGADDPQFGGVSQNGNLFDQSKALVYRGVMKEECAELLNRFFRDKRA